MNSIPPESGSEAVTATDFQSLSPAPVSAQAKRTRARPTDFASVRGAAPLDAKRRPKHTFTDSMIDFFTPFMIFVMMEAVVLFLVDVRFIFTSRLDGQIRMAAFFFVMGVVALNRLANSMGKEHAIVYALGLGGAAGGFALFATSKEGSVAGSFLDYPVVAAGFNMVVVAFLWWITNRLTRECCIDRSPASGELGILTGAATGFRDRWRQLRAPREPREPPKPRKRAHTDAIGTGWTMELVAVDPSERAAPEEAPAPAPPPTPTARLSRRHPGISVLYLSIPVMLLFVAGQYVLQSGGRPMVIAGYVFVGIYTMCALMLLMLTSLRSLRAYFRERKITMPAGVGAFWMVLGVLTAIVVVMLSLWAPMPAAPIAPRIAQDFDPNTRGRESSWDYRPRQESTPTDQEGAERDPNLEGKDDGPQSDRSGPREDGEQDERGDSESKRSDTRSERSRERQSGSDSSSWDSSASDMMGSPKVAKVLGVLVVIVLGLFLAYGLLRGGLALVRGVSKRRARMPGFLTHILGALERLFAGLTQLPSLPRRKRKVRVQAAIATSTRYVNPLSGAGSVAEKVRYSYDALCALAQDVGAPRPEDQTPFEFMGTFPEALDSLRKEAAELTGLYVAAAYSPAELDARVLDRLRHFWISYERLRRRVVR